MAETMTSQSLDEFIRAGNRFQIKVEKKRCSQRLHPPSGQRCAVICATALSQNQFTWNERDFDSDL